MPSSQVSLPAKATTCLSSTPTVTDISPLLHGHKR
nr:MAG TPA: hypothetical protein [Caudoviricetes sp.]